MNRIMILSMVGGLTALLSSAVVSQAQHQHEHSMNESGSPDETQRDERVALAIGAGAEAGLTLTMREHLEAINSIVAALGRQDFEKAAKVAREELGFSKHHQAMKREAGATFPPKYHELAMAHHQAAEDLAKTIPSKDFPAILPQLAKTIDTCVACHRVYKL